MMKRLAIHLACIGFLVLTGPLTFGQSKNYALTFCVHQNGDTIKNLIDAYVDIHKHPQQFFYTLANGSKKSFTAGEIKFLRIYDKSNSFKDWVLTDYIARELPVKKEEYCYHFVQTEFIYNQFSISRTPYCNQCTSLILYLVKPDDQKATQLTRKNFKQLVETYFKGCKELEEFAKSKRYTPYRLSKFLN